MSDMGGGIPRSLTDVLFHYMYSTAPKPSASVESTPLVSICNAEFSEHPVLMKAYLICKFLKIAFIFLRL